MVNAACCELGIKCGYNITNCKMSEEQSSTEPRDPLWYLNQTFIGNLLASPWFIAKILYKDTPRYYTANKNRVVNLFRGVGNSINFTSLTRMQHSFNRMKFYCNETGRLDEELKDFNKLSEIEKRSFTSLYANNDDRIKNENKRAFKHAMEHLKKFEKDLGELSGSNNQDTMTAVAIFLSKIGADDLAILSKIKYVQRDYSARPLFAFENYEFITLKQNPLFAKALNTIIETQQKDPDLITGANKLKTIFNITSPESIDVNGSDSTVSTADNAKAEKLAEAAVQTLSKNLKEEDLREESSRGRNEVTGTSQSDKNPLITEREHDLSVQADPRIGSKSKHHRTKSRKQEHESETEYVLDGNIVYKLIKNKKTGEFNLFNVNQRSREIRTLNPETILTFKEYTELISQKKIKPQPGGKKSRSNKKRRRITKKR